MSDKFIVGQEAWFYKKVRLFDTAEGNLVGNVTSSEKSSFNDINISGAIFDKNNNSGNVFQLIASDGQGGWNWIDVGVDNEVNACNLNKVSLTENINVTYANRVAIRFDNQVYIRNDTFVHSTTSLPERLQVKIPGIYLIGINIGYNNTGAEYLH